ncbi:MAG: double-strand break repair helicase AddA [Hyphomicrobiaceae bacterium]
MRAASGEEGIEAIRRDTRRAQAAAADPSVSAWVSANAGTGKTHVLTRRVLRLLLSGTRPERILCLTYTKAAAAEMSTRIFRELGFWVTHDAPTLDEALREILGRPADVGERQRARTLFAHAIETPGGLKVQTIHSFCEALLQRFPLEAGVPPGFAILDETTSAALLRDAIDSTLARATRNPGGLLGQALSTAVAYAADESFDNVLKEAVGRKDFIEHCFRRDIGRVGGGDPLSALEPHYRMRLGVPAQATTAGLTRDVAALVSDHDLSRAASVLLEGGVTDRELATCFADARRATTDEARATALVGAFLTGKGAERSDRRFITKAIRDVEPGLTDRLVNARSAFARIFTQMKGLEVVSATLALMRLADSVLADYRVLKNRRAALDYDDLVRHAASLLTGSEAAPWVLFKLDGGIDHILVDESQDTAPEQWRIVSALAGEFFSGEGAHDQVPTLFAVGDEKQSIYSFQGARPEAFARMGREFREAAGAANRAWRDIPLTLSFRTVAPILAAVDRVFANSDRTPGLSARGTVAAVRHAAHRIGQSGLVEVWEPEQPSGAPPLDVWAPLPDVRDATGVADDAGEPAERLAARIADRIAHLVQGGERLASEDRSITPGDILILVRKRAPFVAPMAAALKARGIPVAGADRLRLTQQIAVKDLLALGDFLTLPEDDLSLAVVLKSPLFGLDDDDLVAIAHGRKGSLWKGLLDARAANATFDQAASLLRDWRRRADFQPPYEFFAGLLQRDGMRSRLIERLGLEAADGIDELLSLAMEHDEANPPSLTGFLAWLRAADREVKRDMEHGRDEVRIMTVHGAKGLEAPIVFLPDTCGSAAAGRRSPLVGIGALTGEIGAPDAFVWATKGASLVDAVASGKDADAVRETEELNRLLYVAMTRARDRLYIAGFDGRKKRPPGCWYNIIDQGLDDVLAWRTDVRGRRVRRIEAPQEATAERRKRDLSGTEAAQPLEAWAMRLAPREQQLTIPLAPSRLAPYEVDEAGDPVADQRRPAGPGDEPPPPSPGSAGAAPSGDRFLRGTLTHGLLQHLPALPVDRRRQAAVDFVARRGAALTDRQRRSIVAETMAILESEELSMLFGPDSRAEVAITAELPRPSGRGAALKLAGQIDRLVVSDREVLIVDYKTNRPPPANASDVAQAYLLQLAAYRLALAQLFPEKALRAQIIWTDGPRLMPIPDALIVEAERSLWDLDVTRLDGG